MFSGYLCGPSSRPIDQQRDSIAGPPIRLGKDFFKDRRKIGGTLLLADGSPWARIPQYICSGTRAPRQIGILELQRGRVPERSAWMCNTLGSDWWLSALNSR
jgi:hypothetical protein